LPIIGGMVEVLERFLKAFIPDSAIADCAARASSP